MKKTLLFSDVHLKVVESDLPRYHAFVKFLRGISPSEYGRVICLGDLFDFWFEYRHVIFSDFFEVLHALANLHDAGVELHLICGNHDFWGGRFLRERLGIQVHEHDVYLPFGDKTAYLVHGDGINPKDWKYRTYKRIARNPLVIRAFRLIHPDWAMGIARFVSHSSRTLRTNGDAIENPEALALKQFAKKHLAAGKADMVFSGHSHDLCIQEYPTPNGMGVYVNPGEWLDDRSYIVWDGESFQVKYAPK